jgi:hypothetical protein
MSSVGVTGVSRPVEVVVDSMSAAVMDDVDCRVDSRAIAADVVEPVDAPEQAPRTITLTISNEQRVNLELIPL